MNVGGHLTIIGGLAPALLVLQVEPGLEPHIGTLDLDMCMSVNLLAGDVGHYENLQKGLEAAGFEVLREDSKPVSWRWRKTGKKLVVEFLCPVPWKAARPTPEALQIRDTGGATVEPAALTWVLLAFDPFNATGELTLNRMFDSLERHQLGIAFMLLIRVAYGEEGLNSIIEDGGGEPGGGASVH